MSQQQPLVSVVCLCYNHKQFLEEAILSVISQTYSEIEIIIVDDFSSDKSREGIVALQDQYQSLQIILQTENKGNCKSFNEGLVLAKGKYVIDFATDDVMLPNRVEEQVNYFETLSNDYGVIYSNSEFIDSQGKFLGLYSDEKLPQGNVFSDVLSRHIYEPSSMMVKTDFFKEIGGYNEALAYEDFDFVLRTSRQKKVGYIDKVLTKRRKSDNSHSTKLLSSRYEKMFHSTFLVCKEVNNWCETEQEKNAWRKRVKYESFLAMRKGYENVVSSYVELFKEEKGLFLERNILSLYVFMKSFVG